MSKYSRPSRLLRLILEYGEAVVFKAGVECLGYPGTLVTHRGEAIKIETFLTEGG